MCFKGIVAFNQFKFVAYVLVVFCLLGDRTTVNDVYRKTLKWLGDLCNAWWKLLVYLVKIGIFKQGFMAKIRS